MNDRSKLDSVFNPKTIAIAGVSSDDSNWSMGRRYLEFILDAGFPAENISILNPTATGVLDIKAYANIKDVPGSVDYIICCIPARYVPKLVTDSKEKGVKAIQMFTAGFAEAGTEDTTVLQKEICDLANHSGLRLIGPNCMGPYCPKSKVTFGQSFPAESGHVAFLCQSGGNSIHFVRSGSQRGLRFSKVLSYGNACDVDESDLLEYYAADPDTEIITAYIEGVKDGKRFARTLKEAAKRKPVIVLKGGLSEAGARAAAGHTGALSTAARTWEELCRQAGAISVHSMEELIDMAVTFSFLRPPAGRRVALMGVGGGSSVLAVDACLAGGLSVEPFPIELQNEIGKTLGSTLGTILPNPIDMSAPAFTDGVFYSVFEQVAEYDGIDMLLLHDPMGITPMPSDPFEKVLHTSFTDGVTRIAQKTSKTVAAVHHSFITAEDWASIMQSMQRCYEAGVPTYNSIYNASKAIDCFIRYHENRQQTDV